MFGSWTTPPDAAHRALALELDAALTNDPLVDELAFVPSATLADLFGRNARTHPPGAVVSAAVPGAFVLVEHKLAVALSALAPLHAFAREALRRADAADLDRTENRTDRDGREGEDDGRGARDVGVDPETRADALRLLLLVNGDHATAWNRRNEGSSRTAPPRTPLAPTPLATRLPATRRGQRTRWSPPSWRSARSRCPASRKRTPRGRTGAG